MVKFISKSLDNFKLNARFNLFITLLLMLVFSSLGYYLYKTQKTEIFNKADKQLIVLLEDLINIFEVQTDLKKQKIRSTMSFAKHIFDDMGGVSVNDSNSIEIELVAENREINKLHVDKWFLDGKEIHNSTHFVDFIKRNGIETATILQKVPFGYVRVSTNVADSSGKRVVGTFIPNTSIVAQKIEKGERVECRIQILYDWYLAAYEPIKVNGEIVGILSVAVKQMDYNILRPIFYNKKYFQSGYPYVVSGNGFSVLNPNPKIEGSDLRGTSFLKNLISSKENHKEKFRYKWPENEKGQWKWTYLKYFEPLDLYIATSVFEYELYSGLDKIQNGIIWGVMISILIFFIGISFIIRPITASIQKLVSTISTLSKGKLVDTIFYQRKDEIGDIFNSLNVLIRGWSETAKFSNEIEKGNFNSAFSPLSTDDILGNSLLDMRLSLKRAKEDEEKRKIEDDQRNWAIEGLARFSEIQHQNSDNLQDLADSIMRNLVKYIDANQGGAFILSSSETSDEKYFELVSAYAYNRKKFYGRRVEWGEGLIGMCAMEKDTIYMTNVPENYLEIESGLGFANPSTILIVPMKMDDRIFGVIELASFQEMPEYVIKFVEKLAENLASTLATVRINEKTAELLEQSRHQAEAMATQEEQMLENLEKLTATQEQSARREAEMRGVVNALDASFLVSELDMSGKILKQNKRFVKLFGMEEHEVIGKYQIDLLELNPEERKQYIKLWDKLRAGKRAEEVRRLSLSGQETWMSETYTPIFDSVGVPYKVLCIAVDITESKKQEIEIQKLLQDSRRKAKKLAKQEKLNTFNLEKLEKTKIKTEKKEREIRSILDAIDNTVLRGEYTKDGTIITVNKKYLNTMNYSLEELKGHDSRSFIPKEELKQFNEIWQEVLQGKDYDGIVRRKTKSNKDIWLILSYTPVVDEKGRIRKILLLASDITKQKVSETRMRNQAIKLLDKNKLYKKTTKRLQTLEVEFKLSQQELLSIRTALNETTHMITYNFDGTILDATEFALRKMNKKRKEIVGQMIDKNISSKAEKKDADTQFWADLKNGKTLTQINFVVEGEGVKWLSETYTPVFDNDGLPWKVIKISSDISCKAGKVKHEEKLATRNSKG